MTQSNANNAETSRDLLRIIQETVPGKQITLAHVIANPRKVLYQKLGLNPKVDYTNAAIGVLTMCPYEMAILGADIATKSANVDLGFVDRFSGTLIITGSISSVEVTLQKILNYASGTLNFSTCPITRT